MNNENLKNREDVPSNSPESGSGAFKENNFVVLKPIEKIPKEELLNTIFEVLSDGSKFESKLSQEGIELDDTVWMKVSLGLDGIQPIPITFDVEGTKDNFSDNLKDAIEKMLQTKDLKNKQNIEYMNCGFYVAPASESEKPKEDRINKITSHRKIVSQY